jgi:hypothetical protein
MLQLAGAYPSESQVVQGDKKVIEKVKEAGSQD